MDKDRKQDVLQATGLSEAQLDELIANPYKKMKFNGDEFLYFEEENNLFKFDGVHSISIDNVSFDTLEEVLSIYKNDQEYTLKSAFDEFVDVFEEDEHREKFKDFVFDREFVENTWNEVKPMTAKEALNRYENMEQRMIALRFIGAEGMISELNAELLDEQTITKEQEELVYLGEGRPNPNDRNPKNFEKRLKKYDDTYKLYRIHSNEITAGGSLRGEIDIEWIYVCGMKDASTEREYYIFVEPEVGERNDAISAIASTLRVVDGEGELSSPLSKEDYFTLRSET